jgi:hypothetical protein
MCGPRSWKVVNPWYIIINDDLSHAYLGSNIVSIPEHHVSTALPIRENSGEHFTN